MFWACFLSFLRLNIINNNNNNSSNSNDSLSTRGMSAFLPT